MSVDTPQVIVVYATAAGSTRSIAERIAERMTARGCPARAVDVDDGPDLTDAGVVVLGSAVHSMQFLPSAVEFVRTHRRELRSRDVHVFSVGLGPALRGPIGRLVDGRVPSQIADLAETIGARELHAFAGHLERDGMGTLSRILYRLMGGGRYGDLRDLDDIDAWADHLAETVVHPRPA